MARKNKSKKDQQPALPPASPKPAGFFKRLERRFFSIFNDKSARHRKIGMRLVFIPAALGLGAYWHDDPSSLRTEGGTEQAAQYSRDISQLAIDSRAFAISPQGQVVRGDVKALIAFDDRMKDLAARLATDGRISEKDALALSTQFIRDLNDPVMGAQLRDTLEEISKNAAFLDDARAALSRDGIALDAATVLAKADSKSDSDYLGDLFIAYILLNMLFGDNVINLLRRGSRRDDTLKKEERAEIIMDNAARIRAMLTPKGETPPPANPPTPPAPEKKRTNRVTKRA